MNFAVAVSERVHWIGELDPGMRTFDVILKTPSNTARSSMAGAVSTAPKQSLPQ
ncbi:MAG: hypothetical protein JNL68_11120 [Burkholderiales bacterium]|nr:hypothetical protein [Burkholderiales bacterium]